MSRKRISSAIEARVRAAACYRCGYCLTPQSLLTWTLELEHLYPVALGGTDDEENLWLSCHAYNQFKNIQIQAYDPVTGRLVWLFNPRRQKWKRHFQWSIDGTEILGRTAIGRATVLALKLNNAYAVTARRLWVSADWHPPQN